MGTTDGIIASREMQIEQKYFRIEYRENERGRFCKITEDTHGRRSSVIIPESGLSDFGDIFNEILDVHEGNDAE